MAQIKERPRCRKCLTFFLNRGLSLEELASGTFVDTDGAPCRLSENMRKQARKMLSECDNG